MSRVGKTPIMIPGQVTVTMADGEITVVGPKGSLTTKVIPEIAISQNDGVLTFSRQDDEPTNRSLHGLMRSLTQNMITGVSDGFSKQLEINGVGYRVTQVGNSLKLQLGFSHDINYQIPQGVDVKVEQNVISLSSIDKQKLGQVAAEIRSLKKPEPYKGKGIKYVGERIIRKSGKSGKEK
jgi:large subunit ribosomal protein L6